MELTKLANLGWRVLTAEICSVIGLNLQARLDMLPYACMWNLQGLY